MSVSNQEIANCLKQDLNDAIVAKNRLVLSLGPQSMLVGIETDRITRLEAEISMLQNL